MKAAIKTPSGKVVVGKVGDHHKDIPAKGQHVFVDKGKTLNRIQAAKVLKLPGITALHSHMIPRNVKGKP